MSNPAQIFLEEAADLLIQIEEVALTLKPGLPADDEVAHLFRAFHTIKGSGSMFGFDAVAGFTHHVETLLDKVRDSLVPLSRTLIDLILASKDHIKELLNGGDDSPEALSTRGDHIVASLNTLLPTVASTSTQSTTVAADQGPSSPDPGEPLQTFQIHFVPHPAMMVRGTNPLSLLDELRGLGECTVVADLAKIPPLEDLTPDFCLFAWDITLNTRRGLNAIKDVFIFVEEDCEIRIDLVSVPGAEKSIVSAKILTPKKEPEKVAALPAEPTAIKRKPGAKDSLVRVPSAKLDQLVNLVGEMVMNQSRLAQVSSRIDSSELAGPVEALERLVAEMRDSILGIRMMPIGSTFSRFKRLVHDLSRDLHKEIELVTEGADTELDKTVLDQLGDPLVHLIRNSIDHGIETPEERIRLGKPQAGTIRLAASHEGSQVVVTIQDDGKGIDAARVRAKAIEKGLITPDASLTEKEVFGLIFLPGFSTASQITNVSGRGVGMDVVKKQLDALRGGIHMESLSGHGTTIRLTLPLTLAIIEGLLVEIAGDQFIFPMSVVTENVELQTADRNKSNGRNLISIRGELVPYIRLRELFAIPGEGPAIEKIVIVSHSGQRVGIVVDRVLGSHQTVIQSLGHFYRDISVVSGATIMGDGRVALIVDLSGVVNFAESVNQSISAGGGWNGFRKDD